MENPIKMDDLGVPLFLETPIYLGSISSPSLTENNQGFHQRVGLQASRHSTLICEGKVAGKNKWWFTSVF